MTNPVRPGTHIKQKVIPAQMTVKEAAKLLGVGRPALSNLLNGNAALSPEMAARLEKAFGVNAQELLKLQAQFDQFQQRTIAPKLPVGAYVPPFLKITAKQIDTWVTGNLEARSLIAVLLRKLVNSTGQGLTLVDFPGYDEAERKGWDGRVDADGATQWIPIGQSGWEFGCNEDTRKKANKDYAARVKAIQVKERAKMHFVFVTPHGWDGKEKWRQEKEALGEWESVRVYDASDIEQWLEQSLHAQRWLAEKIGIPYDGVFSLEEQWHAWASVTEPELSRELFAPSVEHFTKTVKDWIQNSSPSPLTISADSKMEAVAFLYCMFETQEEAFASAKDQMLVFSSGPALRKLSTTVPAFIPIVLSDEAERELGSSFKNRHSIIVRPRTTVDPEPTIKLDLLRHETFRKALEAMGIKDHLRIDVLGRESGYSPTILRRRLSKLSAISSPEWAKDAVAVRRLVPIMFVGAWHTQSKGDCEVMSVLAGKACDDVELDITELLNFDDPPVWSVGRLRGVSSKIDAFFAVQGMVTLKDLNDFLLVAEIVLSEEDPTLDLPEDQRAFAELYGKSRQHSDVFRNGICETLVLLAVHGNHIFRQRLGIDIEAEINLLIRRLLTGEEDLNADRWLSHKDHLPFYAEAAPQEFLDILREDLKLVTPQVYSLMTPADNGIFGSCPRAGLLWALESLAWRSVTLSSVCWVLAKLSEKQIKDNWVNKPENSLQSIFRCWMPQTAASLDIRIKALELVTREFPEVGWKVCVAQFAPGNQAGHYSHRPRWRGDASGAGQPLETWDEITPFLRKAIDLALTWPSHNEKTLGDLVSSLHKLTPEDEETVWGLVAKWATEESDENRKAILRERVRCSALLRSSVKQGLKSITGDNAKKAYDLLIPKDTVTRNQWLFAQQWVPKSMEELDLDFRDHEEKIRKLRINALNEIWTENALDGIRKLLSQSGSPFTIGWHMAEGAIVDIDTSAFVRQCLEVKEADYIGKFDELLSGYLNQLHSNLRDDLIRRLAEELPQPLLCRLMLRLPFESSTWSHVNDLGEVVHKQYWNEVVPGWLRKDSLDLNSVIDWLLDAGRPHAAFVAIQYVFSELETSRLKRLLHAVGTCGEEEAGTYRIEGYHLSEALDILQSRAGVSEDEMASLEVLFVNELIHQPHHITNLERQLGKSPELFVQLLGILYRRNDGGEDPEAWKVDDPEKRAVLATAAYRLLSNFRRIPGADDNGMIDQNVLESWVRQVRLLCVEYGRGKIGDQMIGEILSSPKVGQDGLWPCEEVRKVLEEYGNAEVKQGFQIGVYNSRGAYWCGDGGGAERALAEKYRTWARRLAPGYPYVASVVEGIAQGYDRDADREDADDAVRRRLEH